MATAGYSNTPLAKKLGMKEGFVVQLVNPPKHYWKLFSDQPKNLQLATGSAVQKNFIHVFVKTAEELNSLLPELKKQIVSDGIIWVSWYKKSAGINTDVTEDTIRDLALAIGLVDVKVCAVDEQWSGLKLVIPLKNR